MAHKGQYDYLHRLVFEECAKLKNYVFSLDKQLSELRMHLESSKSEEALEALETGIEPMEKLQADVKKFILHHGLNLICEVEDGVRDCLKQWEMKFGFSEDPGEPSCSKGKEIFQEPSCSKGKEIFQEPSCSKGIEIFQEPSCSIGKEIFQEPSKLEVGGYAHKSGLSPQSARPELEVYANIEASEQKMEELIRECKEGFKKDSDSVKKSLVELLTMSKLLEREEVRALLAIYMQAVRVGNRLCCLLIDFLFMMSRKKNLAAKIERLKSALRCVAEDNKSIFVLQLFNALEIVAFEFKLMKITEVTRPSRKRNLEAMENPESSSNRKSTPEERSEQFLEPILYHLLDIFVKVAADLESIVSHPTLPELQMQRKEELSMLKYGVRKCEMDLERLMNCIRNIEAVASSLLPRNDPNTREVRNTRRFHIQGGIERLL